MADFETGNILGERFEIAGIIGRGGMATVYLAFDRLRNERIALKILHAHLADTPSMRARLRREVAAASRIRHPNALVAMDIHEMDGRLALSLPLHSGQTLLDYVETHPPLKAEAITRLATQLTGALAEAHKRGVVHRDVTPTNVMIDDHGDAALTDFGLARLEDLRSATATGVVGTCGYAAPEVYQGERADPRSDIYSLGAALYFAATKQPPFKASNPMGVLQKQLQEGFRPLSEARPDLPRTVCETITSMLARDPGERPQGARETLEAWQKTSAGNLEGHATADLSGGHDPARGTPARTAPDLSGERSAATAPPRAPLGSTTAGSSSAPLRVSPRHPDPRFPSQRDMAGAAAPSLAAQDATTGILLRPIPSGNWTVVLKERSQERRRRQRTRHRRRHQRLERHRRLNRIQAQIAQIREEIKEGFKTLFDIPDPDAQEVALSRAIANEAGLPSDALIVPDTLYARRFRLIESVDEACAYRLKQVADEVGFKVDLHEIQPGTPERQSGRRLRRLGGPMTAMAIMLTILNSSLAPLIWSIFVATILFHKLFQGPSQATTPKLNHLPLAYGHDLRPYLAEEYKSLASLFPVPTPVAGTLADGVQPVGPPLRETETAAGEASIARAPVSRSTVAASSGEVSRAAGSPAQQARETRSQKPSLLKRNKKDDARSSNTEEDRLEAMCKRAERHLDQFEETIGACAPSLADIILDDLRRNLSRLRNQTQKLGAEGRRIRQELAGLDDGAASAAASRIEARLTRLNTLRGAGEAVNEMEIRELELGLEAHMATLEHIEALESKSTLIMARLLEISSTAADACRMLKNEEAPGKTAPLLLDGLKQEALAAARALEEVDGTAFRTELAALPLRREPVLVGQATASVGDRAQGAPPVPASDERPLERDAKHEPNVHHPGQEAQSTREDKQRREQDERRLQQARGQRRDRA